MCNENYLSVIDFELIFILRVQLVGELRASGFIRNKGQCDVRSLNVHCESFAAIKAALAAGLYPNVGHYSLASGGVATHTEARAQFHFTSTLLPQESRVQDWEADSYFGPPFLGKMASLFLKLCRRTEDKIKTTTRPSHDWGCRIWPKKRFAFIIYEVVEVKF